MNGYEIVGRAVAYTVLIVVAFHLVMAVAVFIDVSVQCGYDFAMGPEGTCVVGVDTE